MEYRLKSLQPVPGGIKIIFQVLLMKGFMCVCMYVTHTKVQRGNYTKRDVWASPPVTSHHEGRFFLKF